MVRTLGGMGGVLWNHQGGESSVSQTDGGSDTKPSCQFCVGRAQKKDNGFSQHLSLGESCPPALTLMPDNICSCCVSLIPLELLPQCWISEQESLIKSMCNCFKKSDWDSRSPPSHSATIATCFHSHKSWGFLFLAMEPWAGGPGVRLGPFTPQLSSYMLQNIFF